MFFTWVYNREGKHLMDKKDDINSITQPLEESEKNRESETPDTNNQKYIEQFDEGCLTSECEAKQQQIFGAIDSLATEMSSLNQIIQERLSYDRTKEEAFERLYVELGDLKKNSKFEQIRPIYMDLILLFDRIENISADMSHSMASSPLSDILKTLSDELLEILYRREVELVSTTDRFDPSIQKVIDIQSNCIEDENNQVVRVVRRGFRYRSQILRAEEVVIKRYSPGNGSESDIQNYNN